ncbi:MAG: hypothetical protein JXQ90_05310 [Cyclobacteriaceae bacterium]
MVNIFLILLSYSAPIIQPSCNAVTLEALRDFVAVENEQYAPFYKDNNRGALAINAAKYKDQHAIAESIWSAEKGTFEVTITTLGEDDGESFYKLLINGKEIGEVQNQPSETNYLPQTHSFGRVLVKNGDNISIAFNAHTNGKIPEGESTAYSRGRWTKITFECK